jgi:hypothetical protein
MAPRLFLLFLVAFELKLASTFAPQFPLRSSIINKYNVNPHLKLQFNSLKIKKRRLPKVFSAVANVVDRRKSLVGRSSLNGPISDDDEKWSSASYDNEAGSSSWEDMPLPPHPNLKHGVLKNGLHYVVLSNQGTKGRFEAHLEILAGSADEREDQQGMAHLVEHIA